MLGLGMVEYHQYFQEYFIIKVIKNQISLRLPFINFIASAMYYYLNLFLSFLFLIISISPNYLAFLSFHLVYFPILIIHFAYLNHDLMT